MQDLLAESMKLAPELAATNMTSAGAASQQLGSPTQSPVVASQTDQVLNSQTEGVFSTAHPAVIESFGRAKAAFKIGDYDTALTELQELSANAQLNFQQEYAVQSLLDKVPRSVQATPPKP